jgi:hypothetical protein
MTTYTSDTIYFSYALVSVGQTVLAEYPSESTSQNRSRLLNVLSTTTEFGRFTTESGMERYAFLIGEEPQSVTCSCIASSKLSMENIFAFLEDLKAKWTNATGLTPTGPNPRFGTHEIASMLRSYNSAQYAKIQVIRDNQRVSQEETSKNLQLALERGAAIDEMAAKGENMKESAMVFRRSATKLKDQLCWEKWRCRVIGGIIGAAVLAGVIGVIVVFAL